MNTGRKAAFLTLGCKVNQYETDAMKELLYNAGYQIVDFGEKADVYVINTCSVTNMADRKSRQMIQRAKKKNPGAVIVAAGCYVQSAEKNILKQGTADILIGNNKKRDIADILEEYFRREKKISAVPDISAVREYESLSIHRMSGHTRAYVKIQDGCNQFCSYCIIPYARGRIRSKPADEAVREIEALAQAGYQEVVLTGIHLSSYGKDLGNTDLLDLIRKAQDIKGILRIRIGSLEPRIITEEFAKGLRECDKVCPHFHLSLQSGCDETLKRMNRHYTTKEYEEALDILRDCFSRPALTADVIAGFVGETEEEFETTRKFLEKIKLYEMHIFKYSVRKGTRAETMKGHLPEEIKTRRSAALLEMARRHKREYEAWHIGRREEVLLEEEAEYGGKIYMQGYTRRYVKVLAEPERNRGVLRGNQLITVDIEGFTEGNLLYGKEAIEF